MNQTYPEPVMDQREDIYAAHVPLTASDIREASATGRHGFIPGLPAVPPGTGRNFKCAEATVTKAFHDAEMARMYESCFTLSAMLGEALKRLRG